MKFWRRMVREESEHKLLSLALNAEDGTTLMTFPGEVVESVRRTISRLITKKTLPARIALVSSLGKKESLIFPGRWQLPWQTIWMPMFVRWNLTGGGRTTQLCCQVIRIYRKRTAVWRVC